VSSHTYIWKVNPNAVTNETVLSENMNKMMNVMQEFLNTFEKSPHFCPL
jgi:hypothetical protein